jgi:hypothetical protein
LPMRWKRKWNENVNFSLLFFANWFWFWCIFQSVSGKFTGNFLYLFAFSCLKEFEWNFIFLSLVVCDNEGVFFFFGNVGNWVFENFIGSICGVLRWIRERPKIYFL